MPIQLEDMEDGSVRSKAVPKDQRVVHGTVDLNDNTTFVLVMMVAAALGGLVGQAVGYTAATWMK